MKLRTVVKDDADEEVVVSCRAYTDKIRFLEDVIKNVIGLDNELMLTIGDTQYFVPKGDILFFESLDGKVAAHTVDKMYYTTYKLYELERILPPAFGRASKSCIINTAAIYSIRKNLAGASEVSFRQSVKKVYVSRSYYKSLMERIRETRLTL